jgi:N-methylhydantoinase B/oxoprolinase/acetone carboxylase alpha subunit
VIRTLIGGNLPMNGGITAPIDFVIPPGLLNPPRGETPQQCAAVVAGNVETSMRIVDVLLGALGVAAASQGTMNNVLIGDSTFGYYETIGGGSGATAYANGASGVHCHMTNTRITDPEVYETRYPVRLWQFAIRKGSGGAGEFSGGDGLVREIEFLKPLTLSLITNRRGQHRPWGVAGGTSGAAGQNILIHADGKTELLPPATTRSVAAGDRLQIQTPGGGGWGLRNVEQLSSIALAATSLALIGTEAIEDNCSTFAGTIAGVQPSTACSSSTAKRWYTLAQRNPGFTYCRAIVLNCSGGHEPGADRNRSNSGQLLYIRRVDRSSPAINGMQSSRFPHHTLVSVPSLA